MEAKSTTNLGERILAARKLAGLSQRQLAAALGVSAMAISKYEREVVTPNSEALLRIGEKTGQRIGFFFRRTAIKLPEYLEARCVLRRKRDVVALTSRVQDWLERYFDLEELVGAEQTSAVIRTCVRARGAPAAEAAADELRRAWRLGDEPIKDVVALLESRGVKVGAFDLPLAADAVALSAGKGRPVVVFKRDCDRDHRRLAVCRALAHLVLSPPRGGARGEAAARRFARAFLVPASQAKRELGERRTRIEVRELEFLASKYGLGVEEWVRRAKELSIIGEAVSAKLNRALSARELCLRDAGPPPPRETPTRFEQLLARGLSEGLFSESRAADLAGKSVEQFWLDRIGSDGHDAVVDH